MKEFKIKDCFICEYCRNVCCGPCDNDLQRLEEGIVDNKNKDLKNHRKQRIKCLGVYCDVPCKLQNKNEVPDIQVLINTIKFLGTELNKRLTDDKKKS